MTERHAPDCRVHYGKPCDCAFYQPAPVLAAPLASEPEPVAAPQPAPTPIEPTYGAGAIRAAMKRAGVWPAVIDTGMTHLLDTAPLASEPQPAPTPSPQRVWIVVKEHAWQHDDGERPTLAYLWPAEFERATYPSFEAASAFIRAGDWPLGWVAMELRAPAPQTAPEPVAAEQAREALEAYGRMMYDAGMDAASDFRDRRREGEAKEQEAAEMLDAALASQSTPPVAAEQAREPLSMQAMSDLVAQAQIAFNLDKFSSFEVALIRKTEAALASQSTPPPSGGAMHEPTLGSEK